MDTRKIQKKNQTIVDRTFNISGINMTHTFPAMTITADFPNAKKEQDAFGTFGSPMLLSFLRGKWSKNFLHKIPMPDAYGNKSMLDYVKALCAANDITVATSEPVLASFVPYSFPLAQKYDKEGTRIAPAFYVTTEDMEHLSVAFPLDGSTPPVRIAGGQKKFPLKCDRAYMYVSLDIDSNRKLDYVSLNVLDPVVIDVSNDNELSASYKTKKSNDVVLQRMRDHVQIHEKSIMPANIVEHEQINDALESHAAKYNVKVRDTSRLLPAIFQKATDITENSREMGCRSPREDSVDVYIKPISDASFDDAVTKFKKIFGDSAHVVKPYQGNTTIRIPNSAVMDHIDVLNTAMDAVFANQKILVGYQKFTKREGSEPDFDPKSWEERFEEQNQYRRQDFSGKLEALAAKVAISEAVETNVKLKKAEHKLAHRLSLFSAAALRADTTQSEIQERGEGVRKAITKVEYYSHGLSERLFKTDYKTRINELQTFMSGSQAYKK